MKKLLFAISTLSAMMAVSCSKTDVVAENATEPEFYEVKIGMSGAITSEIGPLTKANDEEVLITGVTVYSCPEGGTTYSRYAYGIFNSNDISVKLLSGYKYKFDARSTMGNINTTMSPFLLRSGGTPQQVKITNTFIYTNSWYLGNYNDARVEMDMYYGESDVYTPIKGGSVLIDMERVSFGLNVSVQNFESGSIRLQISMHKSIYIKYPDTSFNAIYTFSNFGESYGNPNYYEGCHATAYWITNDGVEIPLGESNFNFVKNKLTKVKINAIAPTENNGVQFSYPESVNMDDSGEDINIGGGESTNTPIN